jgi:M6 family metalloprotease-like protein
LSTFVRLISIAFVGVGLVLSSAGRSTFATFAQTSNRPAAISGKTRALLVFVRFKDDTNQGSGCRADRGWPLTEALEPLPSYSKTLFASTDTPPFVDSTVTDYFYRQSRESLILYADVYPEVVVSEEDASYYRTSAGRGYGHLTAEVFAKLDPEVDFSTYDTNPKDGVVDQVFIILRRDEAGTFTGVADLTGADKVRGRPSDAIVVDGVTVDWASSGSFIYNHRPGHIISQSYLVRIIAHEYGHHIWNPRGVFAGHVPAIRSNTIGYTLMAGRAGGRDGRGDLLISPPERDALGWLEPLMLRLDADTTRAVVLGDYYSTGEALRIDVPTDSEDNRVSFYFANRQRIGWFDQYRLDAPEGCTPYEMGLLRTTGLLAMLTSWKRGRLALDVLPADNTMGLSAENSPYDGDLFGAPYARQITPFTEPSTSLPDGTPTWFALDDIRLTGSPDSAMSFVFIPDFRDRAVVSETSQVSADLGRVVIRGALHVTAQSTLTVENGARLEVFGTVQVDPGSAILAKEGARITIDGVSQFVFEDTVIK